MPDLIRIGNRYINLDYIVGINLKGVHNNYIEVNNEWKWVKEPAVIIALSSTTTRGDGHLVPEQLIFTGAEREVVKPFLERILSRFIQFEVDLPKEPDLLDQEA
jgi:hypothetical protein